MADKVTIAVDAVGGDAGPEVVLAGAARALADDPDLTLVLCGPADVVEPFAASHERAVAQPCTEVIAMGEHPASAVRRKKDSSIVVGCRLVRDGAAQGFFSAGSTGACLAAGTLVMGRIRGVKRPALAQVLPAYAKPTLLLDVGANADCKPEYLLQFAQMGAAYMRELMGVAEPRVGLLNIGEEDEKGSEAAQAANALLREELPGFAGNAEGRDLLSGEFDVIVTDGFTGNVALKTIEGTSKVLFSYVKDALMGSLSGKLGALLVKGDLAALKAKVSPDTYGGSPLLGVKGACVVGHGSSNELAVRNGIAVAATTVRSHVADVIAATVAQGGERA
ncbi:MAG: phosphate acyltransferase PlsX [Eggerthellaceae bacterium]|nr:phosphate acyltransferase PlsX [Eggerthellaceae bacterium]